MAVKKVKTGWQADIRPEGRGGKRIRKTFKTKREAEAFEVSEKAKALTGEYTPPTKDHRRLSDIGEDWYKLFGHDLASGKKRLQQIRATARSMGDPLARTFEARTFLEYREFRLSEVRDDGTPKVTKNHLNHELTYLKTAFKKLQKIGEWKTANPLENVAKLTLQKRHPFFLQLDQSNRLLFELGRSKNPDVLTIANICLSVGCRWGEAQYLNGEDVHNGKIHFQETKNGLSRSIPIEESLEREIFKGRSRSGPLFESAWQAFNFAVDRAGIKLPKGTATHVLRHTYASDFMMDGGDLLQLNKILGHESIEMTMKYAHLAPKHLESAKEHSTLKRLEKHRQDYLRGHNVDTITKNKKKN
ncbi:MAG: phage integrase [Cellvibrionaceae bacterium]